MMKMKMKVNQQVFICTKIQYLKLLNLKHSLPNAIEPFFIDEILRKGTAEEDLRDEKGYIILKEEMYAEINYLEKIKEGKKLIKYQRTRKPSSVFVYLHEIFFTKVDLDETLSMSIDEYP